MLATDCPRRGSPLPRRRQAGDQAAVQRRHVPAQAPGARARAVGEAVQLLEREAGLVDVAEEGAAAAGAEIDGDVPAGHGVRSRRNTSVRSRDTGRPSGCEGISGAMEVHQRRQTSVSAMAFQRASSSISA